MAKLLVLFCSAQLMNTKSNRQQINLGNFKHYEIFILLNVQLILSEMM